jgi:ketosteroid isomerase-like protein
MHREARANMKRMNWASWQGRILLGFLGVILLGSASPASLAAPSARKQIEAVLHAQQEAWNRGDVEAFLQGYWHSPELTFSGSGGTARGWDGVLQRYRKNYPDRASMGELTFSGLEFRQLGSKAYLVLGSWHLKRSTGDVGGVFTLIFQRFPEGWRIIHDHTSAVAPSRSESQ